MNCCKNQKIAQNASYEKNESFKKEGHELHMMRIVIHSLCVKAAGHENWDRLKHECPVQMFSEELEDLINNAVDLSNWATLENYNPLPDW